MSMQAFARRCSFIRAARGCWIVLKADADEEGIGGDDAADALRYLVATKAREVRMRKSLGV
jgi:hypothetical protein